MRIDIDGIFDQIGVPVVCDGCKTHNWGFDGDSEHGITYVHCRTCGRSYIQGDTRDAFVAQLNEVLATFYGKLSSVEQVAEWGKLVACWYVYLGDKHAPVMYCNNGGNRGMGDPHDIPF